MLVGRWHDLGLEICPGGIGTHDKRAIGIEILGRSFEERRAVGLNRVYLCLRHLSHTSHQESVRARGRHQL